MNQVRTVLPQYKAGKVRLPGTQGFDSAIWFAIWFAIFAPKGTDPLIVGQLSAANVSID